MMRCAPHCRDNLKITGTELPWGDSKTWEPKQWYPMPVGFFARDQEEYIIEGYDIFVLEDAESGDTKPVVFGQSSFVFSQALAICEAHNGRKMLP